MIESTIIDDRDLFNDPNFPTDMLFLPNFTIFPLEARIQLIDLYTVAKETFGNFQGYRLTSGQILIKIFPFNFEGVFPGLNYIGYVQVEEEIFDYLKLKTLK